MSHLKLTSNDVIDGIQSNDTVPELIMKVYTRERPEKIGVDKPYDLFTFMVGNNMGREIDCVAYKHLVHTFAPKIRVNEIIRINEAVAKIQNHHNRGNVDFVLRLCNGTEITPLYNDTDNNESNMQPPNSSSNSHKDDTVNGTKRKKASSSPETKKQKSSDDDKVDVLTFLSVLKSHINNYNACDKKVIFDYMRSLESKFNESNEEKKSQASDSSATKK